MNSEDPIEELQTLEPEKRVNAFERRLEERGYEIRPIYEAHEDRVATLKRSIQDLQKQVQDLRSSSYCPSQ